MLIEEFAPAELAMELEIHPIAARRLMENAVDLPGRHPVVWTALAEGRLEVWVARKIADATAELSAEKAAWVDAQVSDVVGTLSPGRLLTLVEAMPGTGPFAGTIFTGPGPVFASPVLASSVFAGPVFAGTVIAATGMGG